MIISAAPFRVSFAGGGSDLPAYYKRRRGAVLSTSINKYLYISLHPYFDRQKTLLKYSKNELVDSVGQIQHPILREVLSTLWPQGGLEIVSTADVPSGTGLGSSSTFTVALLSALHSFRGEFRSPRELARMAANVEIERLQEPIGKQDQYASACGGLNLIEFDPSGDVIVEPVLLPPDVLAALQERLLLFYTGDQRDTRSILRDQSDRLLASETRMDGLTRMVDLAYAMRERLLRGDLDGFALDLAEGWRLKRTLSAMISNDRIEALYDAAIDAGAQGGKLLGAGGGGFLLLCCPSESQTRVRAVMTGCFEMPFRFECGGVRTIHASDHERQAGFVR